MSNIPDLDERLSSALNRLRELNEWAKRATGHGVALRHLYAGNFFSSNRSSRESFFSRADYINILAAVRFFIEIGSVPTISDMLTNFSNGHNFLEHLSQNKVLGDFFTPELWQIDPKPLYELRPQINGQTLQAVDDCIAKIEEMTPANRDHHIDHREPDSRLPDGHVAAVSSNADQPKLDNNVLYRDEKFEQALRNFYEKKIYGLTDPGIDPLMHAIIWDSLGELNEYMRQNYGRGLEADDFLRIITADNGRWGTWNGRYALTTIIYNNISPTVRFLITIDSVPSAQAMLIKAPHGRDFLGNLYDYNLMGEFFTPALWQNNPGPLYELRELLAEQSPTAPVHSSALVAIDDCIAKIEVMEPITVEFSPIAGHDQNSGLPDAATATAPNRGEPLSATTAEEFIPPPKIEVVDVVSEPSRFFSHNKIQVRPLSSIETWSDFTEIQKQMTSRGKSLTWDDILNADLTDGTPLIVWAVNLDKVRAIAGFIKSGTAIFESLHRTLSNGKTLTLALAETGQLYPMAQTLGIAPENVAKLAQNLTEPQRIRNGFDAALFVDASEQELDQLLDSRFGFLDDDDEIVRDNAFETVWQIFNRRKQTFREIFDAALLRDGREQIAEQEYERLSREYAQVSREIDAAIRQNDQLVVDNLALLGEQEGLQTQHNALKKRAERRARWGSIGIELTKDNTGSVLENIAKTAYGLGCVAVMPIYLLVKSNRLAERAAERHMGAVERTGAYSIVTPAIFGISAGVTFGVLTALADVSVNGAGFTGLIAGGVTSLVTRAKLYGGTDDQNLEANRRLRRFGFAAAGIISGLIYGEAADWGANFLYGHKSDLSALIMSKRELLAPKLNASSANSFVSKTSSLTIDALADYEDIKQVVSGMPDSQLWKTLQDLQPVEVRNTAQQTENIYLPRNLQILGPNMENSKELVVAIMGDIYFTSVQGLRKLYENKTKVIGAADADGMTITRLSCVLTFDQIDKWAKIYDSDEASPTPQPVAPQPNGVIEDNGQCRPRRTTAPAARAQPN